MGTWASRVILGLRTGLLVGHGGMEETWTPLLAAFGLRFRAPNQGRHGP